jgi:hypothetical protein
MQRTSLIHAIPEKTLAMRLRLLGHAPIEDVLVFDSTNGSNDDSAGYARR